MTLNTRLLPEKAVANFYMTPLPRFKLKVIFFLGNLELVKIMELPWGISITFKNNVKYMDYLL